MTHEETLVRAIALDLKRIITLMLCGQMAVDRFRSERIALLQRFEAARVKPAAGWNVQGQR